MENIIDPQDIELLSSRLKQENKKIVLAGGCFDLLHPGHIHFLNFAKEQGDILIVLLESDKSISEKKGNKRPINNQDVRSIVLSSLEAVDYVIPLGEMTKNEEYDKLIVQIKPDFIAVTEGDKYIEQRKEQCDLVDAKLVIAEKINGLSTTQLIRSIN